MLKPVEMKRVMIIGPTACLGSTVETLHSLNVLHFTDAGLEGSGVFTGGKPMESASDYSSKLLKIRAAKQLIGGPAEGQERLPQMEVEGSMEEVMGVVDGILGAYREKQSIADEIRSLEERKAEISPLAAFPVPLEHYKGLDSLESFVGTVNSPVGEEVARVTGRFELFTSEDGRFIALFTDRRAAEEVRSLLTLHEFKEFRVPGLEGHPSERVAELDSRIVELRKRTELLDEQIGNLSERSSSLLNAAEEAVSADVAKAEAPLHFSVTEREFVARGWVPGEDFERTVSALAVATGGRVFVAEDEMAAPEEVAAEEPPVKLSNAPLSRPYELLVRLFSLPSYGEYDPTIVVAVTFAVFVGLMINDLGYGILMMLLGYVLVLYFRDSKDMRQLAYILITSGIAGALFGFFVFGLAFGIPITSRPLLNPEDFHVAEGLLLLCVIIGLLHMGLGYAFKLLGSAGSREYRKAAAAAGWIVVLVGFVAMISGIGRNNEPIGHLIWTYIFPWATGPVISVSTLSVPAVSVILVGAGLALLIATEGAFALLESISLLANVISYARLAAIAIAGAALAGAINLMLMPGSFSENPLLYIGGLVLLILAQIFVFIMLTLSASIQALRLNYIEFFVKFFKGGGRAYTPFGLSRKYTTER